MTKKLNLKGVSVETWIRTALLLFAIVNQILTASGYEVLPFSEEEVTDLVSAIFTGVAALVCWWKNNSFTDKAQKADKVLRKEKLK